MLAEEKFEDDFSLPYLFFSNGIPDQKVKMKKYKKSLLKKESHKKKIFKSAKRKLFRKPDIQAQTLKKKNFNLRTPAQEQEILYLFEKVIPYFFFKFIKSLLFRRVLTMRITGIYIMFGMSK